MAVFKNARTRIWIDLDNSPHVVFFSPIKAELEKRGYEVLLTARRCFQVCELADKLNLDYQSIGRHYGKNKLMKVLGLVLRSASMIPYLIKEKPIIGISHGSRSQMLSSKLFGIPTILLFDYEHTRGLFQIQPTWLMAPEILDSPDSNLDKKRLFFYPGIKEDVYVPGFTPRDGIREELGVKRDELLSVIRPPATEANYHNHGSEVLFRVLIDFLGKKEDVRMVMLPRNDSQKKEIIERWPDLLGERKIIIPERVLDGLNLIWHSDIVFSGGGTMNREAAALGAPVYSFFRGKLGAVDRYLADSGRLTLIEKEQDLEAINLKRWAHPPEPEAAGNRSLTKVVDTIELILSKQFTPRLSKGTTNP